MNGLQVDPIVGADTWAGEVEAEREHALCAWPRTRVTPWVRFDGGQVSAGVEITGKRARPEWGEV